MHYYKIVKFSYFRPPKLNHMLKHLRLLLFLTLAATSTQAYSQCAFSDINYPAGIFTPTSAWQTAATNIYAGEYSAYSVTFGSTYQWSNCPTYGGLAEYDSQLSLYNAANTSVIVAAADDGCGTSNELLTWTANFTGTVYVQLNEYNCLTNTTNSTLVYRRSSGGSVNDECNSATFLTAGSICSPISATISGATGSLPTTTCAGTNTDDVWFAVMSSGNGDLELEISPNGTGFDPVVEVFVGTCGALTSIGCGDATGDGGLEGVNVTNTTPNQIVYVRVFDYYTATASNPGFTFCAYMNSVFGAGDVCATALPITTTTFCNPTASNLGLFTASTNPAPSCGGTLNSDAWFVLTAQVDSLLFDVSPNGATDLVAEIYEGGDCGSLVLIGCGDYTLTGETESILLSPTVPGQQFYVRVYDYLGNSASDLGFDICAYNVNQGGPVPPVNNECANATTIIAGSSCSPIAGTMLNATASAPITNCGGVNTEDVWYEIFATDTAVTVEIFPDFSTLGLVAEVFVSTTGDCSSLFTIGCADNGLAGEPEIFNVTGMTPGQSIFVRVYDFLSQTPVNPGFTICAYWDAQSLVPSNDECAGAIPLTPSSVCNPISGTTANATSSVQLSSCSAGGFVEADVWYSFVATSTSANIVVATNTTMDVVIQYFSGSCSGLVSRGCSDFFVAGGSEQLAATGLVIGQTYFVRVYDYTGLAATGNDFTICIQNNGIPANDNCAGAFNVPLTAATNFNVTDNALASQSLTGCSGSASNDVWFSFQAGTNPAGTTINVFGDLDFATVFEVFSGSCASLTSIACVNSDVTGPYDNETITLTTLNPGQVYYVRAYNVDPSITNSTFYISVEGTPVGCNLTAPSVSVQGSSAICNGNSVSLVAGTVSGLTYQWRFNGIDIPGATSVTYSATQAGNYVVFVTNAQGCTASSNSIDITVSQAPTATISANGSTTICGSGSVSLSIPAQSGSSYQWLLNGNPINGATSLSYSANQSGEYSIQITNSSGCSGVSSSIQVTVVSGVSATISTSGNTTICQGSSSILNVNTQVGNSIQWLLNGNSINGANGTSYSATQAGTYSAQVTNGPTCNATSNTITLSVVAGPTASISAAGSTSFCDGNNVTLNVAPVTGASYQWLNNGVPVFGAVGTSISASSSGSYTALATTAACAATSNAISITVNAAPSATAFAQGATTFCQGNSVVIQGPSGSGLSYQWYNNGNIIAGATSQNYTATTTGNFAVQVTQNGCSANSSSVNVTVTAPPASSITVNGNSTVCQGNLVQLSAPTGNNVTYQWALNGTPIQNATGINYTASASGNYTVTVSQGTSCASTSTATAVNILASPTAVVTPTGSTGICQGGSVVLNASTGSGYTYQWQIGGATISGATSSSYAASAAGSYAVVITNTSACTSTSEAIDVTVNANPTATVTASGPTTFCVGGTVLLQANTGNGYSYQWQEGGNDLTGVVNSVFNVSASGNYSVIVTNQFGCSAGSSSIQVNVAGTQAEISYSGDPAICDGNAVTLNANAGSGLSYQWQNNGSNISSANAASYTATTGGNYSVIVTDANNCASTSSPITISVGQTPAAPTVSLVGTGVICEGQAAELTYSPASGLSYSWTSFGSPVAGGTNGSLSVTSAGSYVLTAANSSNCSASSSPIDITVNPLPNVSLSFNPDTICAKGLTVTLSGGSPAGGVYSGLGVASGIFTSPDQSQVVPITYTVTDNNGCSNSAIANMKVIDCTGIEDLDAQFISIFPNPTNHLITLTSGSSLQAASFTIMDATGRTIALAPSQLNGTSVQFNVQHLAAGVYQIIVRQADKVYTLKFVKTA